MAVAPSTIRVQPDSTGKYVDNVEVDTGLVGVGVVERQVISVADPEFPEARTKVTAATPAAGDYGLTVKAEALGAQADAEAAGNGSIIALLKRLRTLLSGSLAVTGTFFQATQPVSGPLTDVQLRATAVPVSGTVTATGGLTDAQLRAAAVPVSGPLTDAQLRAAAVPVSGTVATGGLTDTQLRAAAVPVSGPLTDVQLRAVAVPVSGTFFQGTQPVSGPLTDAQLRAVAVPVSGTFFQGTQPVSGPLTDTQLRAVAVPVSGPLTDTQLRALAVAVSGTFFQATQPVSGPLTDAQLRATAVSVAERRGTTSALSTVAASVTSVQLLAANASRVKAVIWNESTSILYVKEGTTAAASSYSYKLAAGDAVIVDDTTGRLDGLWVSAVGSAFVTETT